MFATSADILNLSLAVSVFGLAVLVGWILVYAIVIIRRTVNILEGIERAMGKVGSFVDSAREKLENAGSYLSVIALGLKEVVSYAIEKRGEKRASGSKKKSAVL